MLQLVRSGFHRLHKNSSIRLIVNSGFCSDSGQKGDDGDKKKPPKQEGQSQKPDVKSSAALNRLNELLSMMTTESEVQLVKKIQLAKPTGQRRDKGKKKKEDEKKQDSDSDSDSDDEKPKDLVKATQKVAQSLGGDAKKTEAELLAKLLGGDTSVEGESSGASLSDIITGMQVDKEGTKKGSSVQLTRSKVVRKAIERKGSRGGQEYFGMSRERKRPLEAVQPTGASVKLFEEEPLNIFKDPAALIESPDVLQTWKKLQDRELRLAVTHPPANYFQKMALWTEQGKLWKFPIDNEQGLTEEAMVSFTEHIFLEDHLEPWCPKRGPIRHFMELVCVGLSKNYFITAQEKKEHILWFRDYFDQKKELLSQVIVQQQETTGGKKLEK
ncbi:small ribosomal subunit protein mS31 [Ochlerotatus camptorhynchus]|uniref:small ribosomal subunit protein mS31 n=1 Tax=Ochlerotatus camptorhynchus TaxID=644619 RepID=UPI0031DB4236